VIRAERHSGVDIAVLRERKALYEKARQAGPNVGAERPALGALLEVWLQPGAREPRATSCSVNGTANEHSALAAGGRVKGGTESGVSEPLTRQKQSYGSAHDRSGWFAASDHGDKPAAIKGANTVIETNDFKVTTA